MDGNSSSTVAAAPGLPQRQINGGTLTSLPDKPSMEKISSLQENPFFSKFGLKSALGTRNRHVPDVQANRRKRFNFHGSLDEEDQPEYRPGSGFVHKLRDKWSHLNSREEPILKRASSLEDLQPGEEAGTTKVISPRIANNTLTDKKQPNVLHPAKLAYRAQSIEGLSQVHTKHHISSQQRGHRQPPGFVHPLRHVDTAWMKEKPAASALKSPRGSHIEAPDVDLARDDIIIIEKVPQPLDLDTNKDTSESDSDSNVTSPPLSYREEILPDELPKPNTVQTVRNIFETNSSLPSWKNSVITKQRPSDITPVSLPLSPVYGAASTGSFSIAGSSPVTSPRLSSSDHHAKPVFSPPAINTSSPQFNEVEHLRPRSGSKSGSSVSSSSSHSHDGRSSLSVVTNSSMEAKVSPSASVEEKSKLLFQRNPRLGETPTPRSPRNTASVKPTVSSKPSSPVKPLPLSTPASAATSYTKSSPVVSVAPYNNKPDKSKDDGVPVEIFSRSRISPKREKTPRINNYSPVSEPPKGLPDDSLKKREKVVIQNNLIQPTGENRLQKFITNKEESRPADRIIQTSQQTTIQIGLARKPQGKPLKREEQPSNSEKEMSSLPILSTKKTLAPNVPALRGTKSQQAPHPQKDVDSSSQSMLYVSSSDSGESDSSTPPETPRDRDSKTEQNGVRGVPSLTTVSRLKQDIEPAPQRFSSPSVEKDEPKLLPSIAPSLSEKKTEPVSPDSRSVGVRSVSSIPSFNQPNTAVNKPEPIDSSVRLPVKPDQDADLSEDKPIKGVSTFIANKLQQTGTNPSQMVDSNVNTFVTLDVNLMDESSTDSDVSPRPPDTKLSPSTTPAASPFAVDLKPSGSSLLGSISDTGNSEADPVPFKKILRQTGNKQNSATQIFSSSSLAEKRKQKQQAASLVPKLDLTGINDDRSKVFTSIQKEVKPCNIVCIGANSKTDRSLLAKNRVKKVNITFKTQVAETFEYVSEKSALEAFLAENPDDKEDDVVFMSGEGFGESSDDKDDEDDEKDDEPTTPRGKGAGDEELLKSNTALSSSGNLQSYRGRFQEDFEWPAYPQEPDPVKPPSIQPEPEDPDSMMLRPADEEDLNTWSTSSVADILF